jgi:hypothetical protein
MLATLGMAAFAAAPAAATNADACGTITQHTMAKAFGLTDAVQHKSVLREPGTPAGVIHIRCRAFAWSGAKPTNSARRRAGLLAGTVAEMRIETWVADSGPSAQTWLANFPKKLAGLRSRARAFFIDGPLHGSLFAPPHYGAEAASGYQGATTALNKVRAFWWTRTTGTLISINLIESRDQPSLASLRALAEKIVPGVE